MPLATLRLNLRPKPSHKGKTVRFALYDPTTGLWWSGKSFKDREPNYTVGRMTAILEERKKAGTGEIKKVITEKKTK